MHVHEDQVEGVFRAVLVEFKLLCSSIVSSVFHAYFILHFTLILFSLSTQITLHFQYFACLFYFSEFFKIFRFSLAQLFLCVYNCLQKAKGSSRAKRAESRMHLLDPEPDLGNANVGRYDMHIFCRYTSTYICFFNRYEHIINRFFQYHKGICFCKNTHTGGTKNYVRHLS